MHPMLNTAVKAARKAGAIINRASLDIDLVQVSAKGRGAFLNDRRLRVSRRTQLRECLIGTGFPFRSLEKLDAYLRIFKRITEETAGIRRPGAAALDLAYVAAGRLDGFWEFGLSPW